MPRTFKVVNVGNDLPLDYDDDKPPSYPPAPPGLVQTSTQPQPDNAPKMKKAIIYSYRMNAGSAPLQFFIAVEPDFTAQNFYTFSLSMKVGYVETSLCEPVQMRLSIDPTKLDFSVFVFPPKSSLPSGSLHNLRVWLHSGSTDHRLFADNDLWVGRDPDFRSIGDANFAMLRNSSKDMVIYQGNVGLAFSFEYESGGAGRILSEDRRIKLDCDPETLSFMIYSIPVNSTPQGATHRLRLWLRTPYTSRSPTSSISNSHPFSPSAFSHPASPTLTSSPHSESYLCLRMYKSDSFKIGAALDFEALGRKVIIATREPGSPVISATGTMRTGDQMLRLVPNRPSWIVDEDEPHRLESQFFFD